MTGFRKRSCWGEQVVVRALPLVDKRCRLVWGISNPSRAGRFEKLHFASSRGNIIEIFLLVITRPILKDPRCGRGLPHKAVKLLVAIEGECRTEHPEHREF